MDRLDNRGRSNEAAENWERRNKDAGPKILADTAARYNMKVEDLETLQREMSDEQSGNESMFSNAWIDTRVEKIDGRIGDDEIEVISKEPADPSNKSIERTLVARVNGEILPEDEARKMYSRLSLAISDRDRAKNIKNPYL